MTFEDMAILHARAFADNAQNWDATEFAGLLESPHVFVTGDTRAFALGRAVADEAELLTLASDPAHRRRGLARAVLRGFEEEARARGACRLFLEVADDNPAALGLYLSAGFEEVARRKAYYTRASGHSADAIILEKVLA